MARQEYMYNHYHYVITEDLQIKMMSTFESSFSADNCYLVIYLKTGGYWVEDVAKRYDVFRIYNPAGEEIQLIEENGWKLRFKGPHKGPHHDYNYINYWFSDKVKPNHEISNSENCTISAETFIQGIRKLRFYSKYESYEMADAYWNIARLEAENKSLTEERNELFQSLELCRRDLASISKKVRPNK